MNEVTPFDILAPTYDADFTDSKIGRLQRERVWSFLQVLLHTKQGPLKILEINCGTGNDALRLAAAGHSVVASDASGVMIEMAKEKKSLRGPQLDVEFVVAPFKELPFLINEKFDIIFSNFGGLNCIDHVEMEQLDNDLHSLIKPGGHLFFVIMGRCCLWEIFYYGFKGKVKTAFRKFQKSVSFTANDATMNVYYYSPQEIRKIFTERFSFLQQHPVGLFIPPSYLEKKFESTPRRLDRLDKLEKRFGYSFLSFFADHFCLIFQKPAT